MMEMVRKHHLSVPQHRPTWSDKDAEAHEPLHIKSRKRAQALLLIKKTVVRYSGTAYMSLNYVMVDDA
jgi:hypothetical protein